MNFIFKLNFRTLENFNRPKTYIITLDESNILSIKDVARSSSILKSF